MVPVTWYVAVVPSWAVMRSVFVASPLVGAAPKARRSYEVRSSARTWVLRSGVAEHFTETDSTRDGSERMFFAVLSAYVVRVQESSLADATSPRSSTWVTRPPLAASYVVVDFVSCQVPSDFRLKPRPTWERTTAARVVPQLLFWVAVYAFHGVSIVLEISLLPSYVAASSWWPVNSSSSV